jgi:hypothetical protein
MFQKFWVHGECSRCLGWTDPPQPFLVNGIQGSTVLGTLGWRFDAGFSVIQTLALFRPNVWHEWWFFTGFGGIHKQSNSKGKATWLSFNTQQNSPFDLTFSMSQTNSGHSSNPQQNSELSRIWISGWLAYVLGDIVSPVFYSFFQRLKHSSTKITIIILEQRK